MVVSTSSSSGGNAPTSWIGHKENGRRCFQSGRYEDALASYRAALDPNLHAPKQDRQMLLSNVVACRLHIGGAAQARAALEAAKTCVNIDPTWAKGHVRLASAYIALGGHSNDACNSLQTALRHDPGNATARQMLVRELRRDHANASQAGTARTTTTTNSEYDDDVPSGRDPPSNPHYVDSSASSNNPYYVPPPSSTGRQEPRTTTASSSTHHHPREQPRDAGEPQPSPRRHGSNNNNNNHHQRRPYDVDDVDDVISWMDRLRFYWSMYTQQATEWYRRQPEYVRSLLQVLLGFLVLYIAFGGRFGLERLWRNPESIEGDDGPNAYEEYRRRTTSYGSNRDGYGRSYYSDDAYDTSYNRRSSYSNYGYYGGGTSYVGFDLHNLLLLLGAGYIAHRMGINPLQALFMMNMMGGGGRRYRRGGWGWGGGWGGGGMMGGHPAGGFGRRRRFGFGY